MNSKWANVQVPKGINRIIKDQGLAPPRPREKRIQVLFEVVQKMA